MYQIEIREGRLVRLTAPMNGAEAYAAFESCCAALPTGVQVALIWDGVEIISLRYED